MTNPIGSGAVPLALLLPALGCAPALPPASTPHAAVDDPLAPGAHRVAVRGAELAYVVAGEGPVVVALPGGPGLEWSYLRTPEAEAHATMVYVQPVGSGDSGRLEDGGYSLSRDVEDLEALRMALGIDRMHVLGHSYGGFVALRYVLEHPDHVASLFLYATSPTTSPEWQESVGAAIAEHFGDRAWVEDAVVALQSEGSVRTDEELAALVPREVPLYFADYDGRRAEYEPHVRALRVSRASLQRRPEPYDVRARLPSIRVPTTILTGRADIIGGGRWSEEMHREIDGSRLVVLENSGHMGHIEEPAAFAEALTRHLEEAGAHSGR